MMTFLALRQRVAINAAAVVGAMYDLEALQKHLPNVMADDGHEVMESRRDRDARIVAWFDRHKK